MDLMMAVPKVVMKAVLLALLRAGEMVEQMAE